MSTYYLTEEGEINLAIINREQRRIETQRAWLRGYGWGFAAGIALTCLLFFLWLN